MCKFGLVQLGPIPSDLINRTIGTELEPGEAVLSAQAHRHIAEDHAADYPLVIANLQIVISEPSYIGQSPKHSDNFELVRQIWVPKGRQAILAAVKMTKNEFGNYNIVSGYCLEEEKVTKRILKGHLVLPKK